MNLTKLLVFCGIVLVVEQIMTSFPVPGEILISPLQDSMLGLIRKDKLHRASNLEHSSKHVQGHSTLLAEKSVSMQANREKKTKLGGRSERQTEMKHGIGCHFENDMTIPEKTTSNKEAPEGKDFLSNGLNDMPISDSACDAGDSLKVISQPSEVSRGVNKNEVKGRLCVSELVKEESLESISGQDYCRNGKKNSRSGSVEKVWEHSVTNSHKDATGNLSGDSKSKSNKISVSSKAYSDVSKCKEELDLQKQSVGEKSIVHEQDERNMPLKKEKPTFEGKNKSKEMLGNGKHAAVLAKESLRVEMGAFLEDKKNTTCGVNPCSSKMQKQKSNYNSKGKDNNSGPFRGKHFEQTDNKLDSRDRPLSDRPKDAYLDDVEVERKVILDKPKEPLSGKKVDNRSMAEASLKDATNACPPIMENGLASQMVPAPVAPVVIEEDWVCCDSCQKWRLLPFGTKPEQLPEKWLCSMLNWL